MNNYSREYLFQIGELGLGLPKTTLCFIGNEEQLIEQLDQILVKYDDCVSDCGSLDADIFCTLVYDLNRNINISHLNYISWWLHLIAFYHADRLAKIMGVNLDLASNDEYDYVIKWLKEFSDLEGYEALLLRVDDQIFNKNKGTVGSRKIKKIIYANEDVEANINIFRNLTWFITLDHFATATITKKLRNHNLIAKRIEAVHDFEKRIEAANGFKSLVDSDFSNFDEMAFSGPKGHKLKLPLFEGNKHYLMAFFTDLEDIVVDFESRVHRKFEVSNQLTEIGTLVNGQKTVLLASTGFEKYLATATVKALGLLINNLLPFANLKKTVKYWIIHEVLQALESPGISDMLDHENSKYGKVYNEENKDRVQELQRQYNLFF